MFEQGIIVNNDADSLTRQKSSLEDKFCWKTDVVRVDEVQQI